MATTGKGSNKRASEILAQLKGYMANAGGVDSGGVKLVDELAAELEVKIEEQLFDDYRAGRK